MSETYYRAEDVRRIMGDGFVCTKDGFAWTSQLIDQIPAADVEPVRHGRWGKKQGGFWEFANCSVCGQKTATVGIPPNYCPNCGAKMDLTDKAPEG